MRWTEDKLQSSGRQHAIVLTEESLREFLIVFGITSVDDPIDLTYISVGLFQHKCATL